MRSSLPAPEGPLGGISSAGIRSAPSASPAVGQSAPSASPTAGQSAPPASPTAGQSAPPAPPAPLPPRYYSVAFVSPLALARMAAHASWGGRREIMGALVGHVEHLGAVRGATGRPGCGAFVVSDALPMPVEGTETRVNAGADAYEHLVRAMAAREGTDGREGWGGCGGGGGCGRRSGREVVVGWYHSHPGYGCWLSGIDVATQRLNQDHQDPYLAIVIDPFATQRNGAVEIGAFRTLPAGGRAGGAPPEAGGAARSAAETSAAVQGADADAASAPAAPGVSEAGRAAPPASGAAPPAPSSAASEGPSPPVASSAPSAPLLRVPDAMVDEFGVYANQYYQLRLEYSRSALDGAALRLLAARPERGGRDASATLEARAEPLWAAARARAAAVLAELEAVEAARRAKEAKRKAERDKARREGDEGAGPTTAPPAFAPGTGTEAAPPVVTSSSAALRAGNIGAASVAASSSALRARAPLRPATVLVRPPAQGAADAAAAAAPPRSRELETEAAELEALAGTLEELAQTAAGTAGELVGGRLAWQTRCELFR